MFGNLASCPYSAVSKGAAGYNCASPLFGRSKASIAETSNDKPAHAKPTLQLPVLWRINPTPYGPTNPPKLAIDVTSAIPDAAEKPVRNSLGNEKNGGRVLNIPSVAIAKRANARIAL